MATANESEPNDVFAQRDRFTADIRTVDGGLASPADVDFLTFQGLAAGTRFVAETVFIPTTVAQVFDTVLQRHDDTGAAIAGQRADEGGQFGLARLTGTIGTSGTLNLSLFTNPFNEQSGAWRLELSLALTGSAAAETLTGSSYAETFTGQGGNDTLIGQGGNDVLDGGTGADTLRGGRGNDVYLVDDVGDAVVELTGEGIDTVRSGNVAVTLAAAVERLEITGTAALAGTGNARDNTLIGNDAANRLAGLGGDDTLQGRGGDDLLLGYSGLDRMEGGTGNDTYVVDQSGDVVVELPGGGTDTVRSAAPTFTLGAEVENLVLIGAAREGIGNALGNRIDGSVFADTLRGEAGNDVLDGGRGADLMIGGAGDDRYVVDDPNDVLVELPGGGFDRLSIAAATYRLPDGVERVTLLAGARDVVGTSAVDDVTGNASNNRMEGGDGNDQLRGGEGDDILIGGGGNDILAGETGIDVLDGGAGDDVLTGDGVLIGGGGADTLSTNEARPSADGGDRIVYLGTDESTAQAPDAILMDRFDRIDLSAIDAIPGGADDAFRPLGFLSPIFREPGEIRILPDGTDPGTTNWLVEANLDNDADAEFVIRVRMNEGFAEPPALSLDNLIL